jgi:hypothetical protein
LFSGTCRSRDIEAVLKHLEARHNVAFDCQNDCELRRGDLFRCIDPGSKRTSNGSAALAGEDVLDIEGDGGAMSTRLCQGGQRLIGEPLLSRLRHQRDEFPASLPPLRTS